AGVASSIPLLANAPTASVEASAELRALIGLYVTCKVTVAELNRQGEALPPGQFDADLEEALNDAYDAMWAAEDQVDAFRPRSAEDLRLKAGFALDHLYGDQSAEHTSDMFAWNLLRELAGRERLPSV